MKKKTPKFLVLTLHSGENEFEECKASVTAQTGVVAQHVVYSGLGNIEAHRRLYSEIMSRAEQFDFFLKLDADMVIARVTALSEIADFFASRPDLDHIAALVHDHFTGKLIPAVHAFSPRVKWELESHDPLFVDPAPKYAGEYVFNPKEIPTFVDHAPNPGRYQAFHFGYHRALKAFQVDRRNRSLFQMSYHLGVLRDLETHFVLTGREDLGLAVLAALEVAAGRLKGQTGDKNDASVERTFREFANLDASEIRRRANFRRHFLRFHLWRHERLCGLRKRFGPRIAKVKGRLRR